MKQVRSEEDKRKEADFIAYKKLIRNLRRGKVEKINSEKACNNITKKMKKQEPLNLMID